MKPSTCRESLGPKALGGTFPVHGCLLPARIISRDANTPDCAATSLVNSLPSAMSVVAAFPTGVGIS